MYVMQGDSDWLERMIINVYSLQQWISDMTKTGYCSVGGDLLNNNNVVSDIASETKFDDSPPNKTMTLKSGPVPNSTAECCHR